MIAPEFILRNFDPVVYPLIQKYRVTDDALLPFAYQRANPAGRFLHGDWAVFRDTPRILTAYSVPLPFRQISGACEKKWMLWDTTYPASPSLLIEDRPIWDGNKTQTLPHALVDCQVEGSGEAVFAAYLGDGWYPVFTSYRRKAFGRLYAQYSGGLKQDLTVGFYPDGSIKSDVRAWWDPPSVSFNKTQA